MTAQWLCPCFIKSVNRRVQILIGCMKIQITSWKISSEMENAAEEG